METHSQSGSTDRIPVAAGRFYPAEKELLKTDISILFESCRKVTVSNTIRAIISPHAGYVYSGKTAAASFSSIPKNTKYKNIFLVGSSHVMSFNGASVYNNGDYSTPLGKVAVNKEIASKLINGNSVFNFPADSHYQEHSLEVQLPFIQSYFSYIPPIIPIIIGTVDTSTLKQIAEALRPWFTNENLFIISSDFSHYPPYNEAVESDRVTANGIVSGNPETFLTAIKRNSDKNIKGLVTSMCGWTSALTLLYLSETNSNLKFKLIDYCNSGDSPNGVKEEVVGYYAIALIDYTGDDDIPNMAKEFSFNKKEKDLLFSIARSSIQLRLTGQYSTGLEAETLPSQLKDLLGAFVTLKIGGKLRGCIGRFISADPLYKVISASAISSAFEDPRFTPLTSEEFKNARLEITVIGPLKKINNISDIILGRHGIYIKKNSCSGTMLPQVATENKWSVEEFLGHTSRDKAGLEWDGWKDAELFIYEGVVLEET
jgi:hypothetical protein